MDPAKHSVPDRPAAGRLRGKPFTPDRVELEGNKLTFRQGKDFFADLEVDIFLHLEAGKPASGHKLVVRPAQKWTDGIPSLHVSAREGDNLPDTKFVNDDYALTLELGQPDKGKIPGKIYLSLPDSQQSFLAGTFVASRKRSLSEPPDSEEVPFLQGKVEPAVKKGQTVWVGYVGLPAGDDNVISDGVGSAPFDEGESGGMRNTSFAPRTATLRFEKFVPKYDLSNLPPGRYLVYARQENGPVSWRWTDVTPASRLTVDLKLDPATAGTVEIKVPAGFEGRVGLTPADLGSPAPTNRAIQQIAAGLAMEAEAKQGVATIKLVPAGKYVIRVSGRTDPRGTVDVTAGKTSMAELSEARK